MPRVALVPILQAASAVGSGLTALRLYSTGMSRIYRIFFVYLLFCVPYGLIPLALNVTSDAYFYFYLCTQPIIWFFYIKVILELFRLALARHRGIYTLGRWAMYIGTGIAVAISALSLLPKITPQVPQVSMYAIGTIIAIERGLDFSLVIFLLLMLFLLNLYTVPLSRNIVVHAVVYTVFFLCGSLGMILRTLFGLKNVTAVNAALMAVSCGCVTAWYFLLSPRGEEARVKLPWFEPDQEERILQHLDSMNATLMKAAGK